MPRPSPYPGWLDEVWAKSPERGEGAGETLAQHTWSVLSRLADLKRMRPELAAELGVPSLWPRLFWTAFLHDMGKCAPGFQARLRGDTTSPASVAWRGHRHEVFSLAFVDWVAPAGHDWRDWIIAGIASHHRDQAELASKYDPLNDDGELVPICAGIGADTLRGLYRWLRECAAPWAGALGFDDIQTPGLANERDAVAGFASAPARIRRGLNEFARFVSRLENRGAFAVAETLLRGLVTQSDHTASAHAGRIHPLAIRDDDLRAKWPRIVRFEQHQEDATRVRGSALLVAPTGSGKTEAALLWAANQAGAPRLFYTLPYQASMNAMNVRLEETLGNGKVGLAHGRALLALYRLIGEEQPNRALAEKQARRRINLARLHHLPAQIFSPYQMLKAMYRLKGYEGMLTDFYGASFIFDEIHAYEPARLALIIEMIRHLREHYRARFFVMTATFPGLIRDKLADALGNPPVISATPDLYARFCRHRLRLVEGEMFASANWARIAGAVAQGRSVLVCCNTVRRAQQAKQLLRAAFPALEIPLLHGRLNGRDRLARERLVREATGSRSEHRHPIALVATQTVEVSLDIDLDTIFTDPAPMEALVQRFGRVNRRRLQPQPADVHVFSLPDDGQRIYEAPLVLAALAIARREDGNAVPEDAIGAWLDEIYTGDARAQWLAKYDDAAQQFRQAIVKPLRPFNSEDRLEDQFYAAFDGVDVLPAQSEREYSQLLDDDPLRAQELLVSIRVGQYMQIKKAGRVQRTRYPVIIDVPYEAGDDGIGLDLSAVR